MARVPGDTSMVLQGVAAGDVPTDLLVDSGGRPLLGAGENHIGAIGGHTLFPTVSVAMSAPGAYATGDFVGTTGTPLSFTGAFRTGGPGTGVLQSVTIIDKANQALGLELWLFDATVTPPTDNAAWTITDADALHCLGVVAVAAANYKISGANAVIVASALGLAVRNAAAGTTLFGAVVTRGAPTYASNDLVIVLGIQAD